MNKNFLKCSEESLQKKNSKTKSTKKATIRKKKKGTILYRKCMKNSKVHVASIQFLNI